MEQTIVRQTMAIISAVLCGAGLGLVYDLLRLVRYKGKMPETLLADSLFAAAAGIALFLLCVIFESTLWIYMSVAVGCGAYLALTKGVPSSLIHAAAKKCCNISKNLCFFEKNIFTKLK